MNIKAVLRERILSLQRQIVKLDENLQLEKKERNRSEESLLLDIIGVADALEDLVKRQEESGEDPKPIVRVQRKIFRLLEQRHVRPIVFSANKAEVGLSKIVETQVSDKDPEGTILGEVRKGYIKESRVLRPAEVITSVAAPSTTEEER